MVPQVERDALILHLQKEHKEGNIAFIHDGEVTQKCDASPWLVLAVHSQS